MDERVDENKHPDGRGHEAHTSPHAHHGTSMVVCLQGRARLSLGEDNECVEDLVELAEVEDPAIVRQTLGPHASTLNLGRKTVHEGGILDITDPGRGSLVVVDGIAKATSAVKAAEAIDRTGNAIRAQRIGNTPPHAAEHAPEGPGRVHGEEDVVQDDKDREGAGLADGPGLLAARLVVDVEELDGDGVGGSDGQGHLGVEGGREDVVGDVEGVHDGTRLGCWGDRGWVVGGREGEEARVGHGADDLVFFGHGEGG